MKLLSALLLLISMNAYATDKPPQAQATAAAFANSTSKSTSESASNSNANNGGVEFNDRLQLPHAPGLSSGSSNTTSPHRIYKQRQVSFLLGGYTSIDMALDIVSFVGSKPDEDTQLAACIQSEDFRTWRKLKNSPCPN